jgi:hypothetical protein
LTSLAIGLLIALVTWAFPLHVASAKTEIKTQVTEIELVTEPSNEDNPAPINTTIPVPEKRPSPRQAVLRSNASSGRDNPYSGKIYSKEEVQALIVFYSEQYGIDADVPLCIAKLESGYNQFSKNKTSSASGVFQYLNSTWKGTDEGKEELSPFDAEANIKAAIKYMASRRSTQPWEVRSKCPLLN